MNIEYHKCKRMQSFVYFVRITIHSMVLVNVITWILLILQLTLHFFHVGVLYNVRVYLLITVCIFVVCQSFLAGAVAPAPAVVSSSSRLPNSTPVPTSYFTPVSNNNNNNSSGPAQFVRVVTSNTPIQPKLLPGTCGFYFAR